MIRLVTSRATPREISDMLKTLQSYIKVAVDVRKEILAGGGVMHAYCEAVLLENGSKQDDVWGADWIPGKKKVEFHSLINIRPRLKNRSMEIQDKKVRDQVEKVVKKLLD